MPAVISNELQAARLFEDLITDSVDQMTDVYNRDVLDPLIKAIENAPTDPVTGDPDVESLLVTLPDVFDDMNSTRLEKAIQTALEHGALLGRAVALPEGLDLSIANTSEDPFAIEQTGALDNATLALSLDTLARKDFTPKPETELANLFGQKAAVGSRFFETLAREQKARAFRIAGINKAKLIQRAMDQIRKGISEGLSRRDIAQGLQQIFADEGVPGLPNWHLTVLMRQNMHTTYNIAAKRASESPAVARIFPYWEYLTVNDSSVRPEHDALHRKVFRKDDPFWDTHFPPWDWGCRCKVRDVSQREVDRRGGTAKIVIDNEFARSSLPVEGQEFSGVSDSPDFAFPRDQLDGLDSLLLRTVEPRLRNILDEEIERQGNETTP